MYEYYVYGHYTDDGDLFYIGKGKGNRAFLNGRNSVHDRIAKMFGCNIRILLDNLTEREALFIENELMRNAYERKIILTNADYIELDKTPSDKELLDFVEVVLMRKSITDNLGKHIFEIEGANNFNFNKKMDFYADLYPNYYLSTIAELRPYDFSDNISSLNIEQIKLIYTLGTIVDKYGVNDIKMPFDLIQRLTKLDLSDIESYTNASKPIGHQAIYCNKDNYSVDIPVIVSYYLSPESSNERVVWINFIEGYETIDGITTLQLYLNKILNSVSDIHKQELIDIYDKISCNDWIIDYFDKDNRIFN